MLHKTGLTFLLALTELICSAAGQTPIYLDSKQPVEKRIQDLLGRMTLLEKVGQMNMPCVYLDQLGKDPVAKQEGCRRFTLGTLTADIGPGGGFFTLADNALQGKAREQAIYFNELQKLALEKTRLRIPLLQSEEGTHGVMCSDKTIFPEGLAIGSTWSMDLVRKIYATAAREARSAGIHQLYTLVVEPNRDPRLGRNEEGYSEDPYLCSRIAEAIVRGAQGYDVSAKDKVATGLCHYPGQSQPAGGLERGAMHISDRMLWEVFLPPWAAGIRAGALGVMATYPAIDEVPTHASAKILTHILREQLGFQGLVLSEGGGIGTLVYERVAPSQKEAGQMALRAGLDVGISYESGYMKSLIESVQEGKASMGDIDRAVTRTLRQKFQLGLFEHPYVDPDEAARLAHTKENQDLALRVAREGIVLLKNDGNLLPLSKNVKSIAVIGPNADDRRNQLGDYVPRRILQNVVTVLAGVRAKVPNAQIKYVKGCDVLDPEPNEIALAKQAASQADVSIVVLGERHMGTPRATDGEGSDVASLDLTGRQQDLLEAVASAGKPTVLVLENGRPLSIRWAAEHLPAIVEAWNCGERGGEAVADVLFGDYNPSGRLPITVPRHAGQLPMYYNYMPSKSRRRYVDFPITPLWEFGYGLSYTKFEYSNLNISAKQIGMRGSVEVSADIANAGSVAGEEVVQLYINQEVSSVTRRVKELKGFRKFALPPGAKKSVRFTLTPEELSIYDQHMVRRVEPGVFHVMVGSSSEQVRLKGSFEVR
ncbi:MAG: glycoside hydrolase family 3 C-terminal domain-containing protein [Bryobacterales bacterium]|nr:glycoside hydrolase family 3 C-terminal domain-containing protein [Bryobacterales bacterium]